MRLPHSNALVTAVAAKAYTQDWDAAGTTAAASWTGRCDALVSDERHQQYSGGESSTIVTRTIVVPDTLPVAIGDKLTVSWHDSTITPVVQGLTRKEPPNGVRGTLLLEIEIT